MKVRYKIVILFKQRK